MEMEQEVRILITGQIAMADYERLLALARKRGMITRRSSRPNISAALREALPLGLQAAEAQIEQEVVK